MKKIPIAFFILITLISCELEHIDNSPAEVIDQKQLLDLVNHLRSQGCNCGTTPMPPVKKLDWDYQLERAALSHSIDMCTNKYFDHVSQDGSTFATRIDGTDYLGKSGGENIAMGYSTELAVFEGWRNSPGHCMNMMNADFTDIAVGRSGNYWTMVFGIK
jgi:uncharacterized protein YkwD